MTAYDDNISSCSMPPNQFINNEAPLRSEETPEEIEYINGIRADPSRIDLYKKLGSSLYDRGALAESAKIYEAALRVRPSDASLRFNLAVLSQELQEPETAARHYAEALRLRPELLPQAASDFGALLTQLGRYAEAEWYLTRGLTAAPDAYILYTLSVVLWKRGDLDASEQRLLEALAADPHVASQELRPEPARAFPLPTSPRELRQLLTEVCACRGEHQPKAACSEELEFELLGLAAEAPAEAWEGLALEVRGHLEAEERSRCGGFVPRRSEIIDGIVPRGSLMKLRILENKRFLFQVVSNWTGSFEDSCRIAGSEVLVQTWVIANASRKAESLADICTEILQWPPGRRQLVVKPVDMAFAIGTTLWNLTGQVGLTQASCQESFPTSLAGMDAGRQLRRQDTIMVQQFVQSWQLKNRKLELRAHLLIASADPLIVFWDRDLLFKWGTVPLPEGWVLSGPSQEREVSVQASEDLSFGSGRCPGGIQGCYKRTADLVSWTQSSDCSSYDSRWRLGVQAQGFSGTADGSHSKGDRLPKGPTDPPNSWEIIGVDFALEQSDALRVDAKVLDWNYGPGLAFGRQLKNGQAKTLAFLQEAYRLLHQLHRLRGTGGPSARRQQMPPSRLEVLFDDSGERRPPAWHGAR
ncbi:TMTC1 [Symbiodinium sp. CCMP2592]|nr:TMTC1 [Symbiodinium sp. CCMP2592]